MASPKGAEFSNLARYTNIFSGVLAIGKAVQLETSSTPC